jgi:hypothetical protein
MDAWKNLASVTGNAFSAPKATPEALPLLAFEGEAPDGAIKIIGCLLQKRSLDAPLFSVDAGGVVRVDLNGYAIVPLEDLVDKKSCTDIIAHASSFPYRGPR